MRDIVAAEKGRPGISVAVMVFIAMAMIIPNSSMIPIITNMMMEIIFAQRRIACR